jgi:hypothetical protein
MANRIKRLLVNGARKKLKNEHKEIKTKINYELSQERDAQKDYARELDLMKGKFDAWIQDFINRPKTTEQVVDSLHDLIGTVEDTLKTAEGLRAAAIDIVYQSITKAQTLNNIVQSAIVKVSGACPICKKSGLTSKHFIPLKVALLKAYHLDCGFCGSKIPAEECTIVKNTPKKEKK